MYVANPINGRTRENKSKGFGLIPPNTENKTMMCILTIKTDTQQ